jgi:ribonucleoside-diphosphate reductase beta chain
MDQTLPGSVQDITEQEGSPLSPSRPGANSAELYRRWERQQWSVAEVDSSRDAGKWRRLSSFMQEQLLSALAELETGEECVTATLAALVHNPPTDDDQIFLCTQMADEARHVRFFQDYLRRASAVSVSKQHLREIKVNADYGKSFAPFLTQATNELRRQDTTATWYRAVVIYHLVGEGLLAAAALRGVRHLAKRLEMAALDEGLTNVIRDESRHVSFGLHAITTGVRHGFEEEIVRAHLDAMEPAAAVLVGPNRYREPSKIPFAAAASAQQLQSIIDIGRDRLQRQLRMTGLGGHHEFLDSAWSQAVEKSFDAYEENWGKAHPIRLHRASQ